MEEGQRQVIRGYFREYYKSARISVPEIGRREFGVGGFRKKIESRHMGFASDSALCNYLVREVPLYISHSMAYYRFPEATPMENKGWEGGDLVFDLDVHGGLFLSGEELEKVKGDALNLERVLSEDFGVAQKEMVKVFSGSRGFHLHVRSEEFLELGGEERREITDYVAGIGFDYRDFFEKRENENRYVFLSGPKKTDWGLRGRFCKRVERIAREEPSRIHRGLGKQESLEKLLKCMEGGNWSETPIKDIVERVAPAAEEMKLNSVEVDTGVTIDTKRLIRVPGTLHGSTGLVAKRLESFGEFNPYHDAVASSGGIIRIKAMQDIECREFAGMTMEGMKKEEEKEVPAGYGIYLALKGAALIPS